MITMKMTRPAAEAVRDAVSRLPCGVQANVEAYQAVKAALDEGARARVSALNPQPGLGTGSARAVENMDATLNRRLWGGEGVSGSQHPTDMQIVLSQDDATNLLYALREQMGHGVDAHRAHHAWRVRICEAIVRAQGEIR